MAGRFVRASKYRHVFGRGSKREQCFDNLRITKNAWDTNLVKANPEFISVNWEASGGGAFAVIPIDDRGKLPDLIPLFRGHTAAVLDTDWSPFDDKLIASASDDGKVLIWKVPDGFTVRQASDEIQDVSPVAKLTGHSRKVGHVLFNPSAQNVLASSSGDYTVKLWDVDSASAHLTLKHADIVQSLSWSANGSLLVTTCRDKKLRTWDTRQEKAVVETAGHSGAKNSRAVWMGEHDRVATTGFSKMSDRQLGLWDIRAAQAPIEGFTILDQISGVCMPFWDDGNQMLYLAGKGDGNIRYYEYENDRFEYLSQHTSTDPQRGIAFLPKRGVNTHDNEVARAFRTINDSTIEPVSFIVPRRAEVFQDDIYPPTVGLKPSMSSSDWFGGQEGSPPKFSMESMFAGQPPEEVPTEHKPSPTPIRTQTPQVATPVQREPEPAQQVASPVIRSPPPSIRDNQSSIASMASRFADEPEEEAEDDEASGFEVVSKPAEHISQPAPPPQEERPVEHVSVPVEAIVVKSASPPSASSSAPVESTTEPASTSTTTSATRAGGAAEGLRTYLAEIKSTVESQQRALLEQSEQIEMLKREVAMLKAGGLNGAATNIDEEED